MTAPTKRCPFKVNATTNAGITCENTDCMAYDTVNETCTLLLDAQNNIDTTLSVPAITAARINN